MTTRGVFSALVLLAALSQAVPAGAQSLGTFRWQLQPFCNVIVVNVVQSGAVYRLEGWDDQCGGATDRASVIGTAFPNPDGSIGFGLNIVTAPGGIAVHVDAEITLATLSGSWRDSGGRTGTYTLTPGAGSGGSPRPPVSSGGGTGYVAPDGSLLAAGTFGSGGLVPGNIGTRLMWNPRKSAFRVGTVSGPFWDDGNVGQYSTAFGANNVASGSWSTALGFGTNAQGPVSTAMGQETQATGAYSTSMGYQSIASGISSTSFGTNTRATGQRSLAAGLDSIASGVSSIAVGEASVATGARSFAGGQSGNAVGNESFAFGLRAQAGGAGSVVLGSDGATQAIASGTFVFADRSTTTPIVGFAPNEFLVRAAGGVGFYTNAGLTTGLRLANGGSQWLGVSDATTKHLFRDLDGEDVLAKLARLSIQEWSYKAQDATIRHVGPTAQEFTAAFGLGEDPLRIGTMDADGVALRAIQALEARTRELQQENATLKERLAALEARMPKP